MPFKSPNFTQVPNDLLDDYLPLLGNAELRLALALIRLTFGYHRIKTRASLTTLADMTGLTKSSILSGAAGLERRGLIIKMNDGGVTIYELSIETVELLDRNSLVSEPNSLATRLPSIKETVKQSEINIGGEAPISASPRERLHKLLAPDTQAAYMLFNLIGDEQSAKNRKPPKNFPSLLCKEKFEKHAERLGDIELEKAIRRAIERSILSISGITDFIGKWADQPPKHKGFTILDETTPADYDALRIEARQRIDKAVAEAKKLPIYQDKGA